MAADDKHRSIGTVISVSAEKLTVELHRKTDNFMVVGFDDMQYVAQLGSYILIPVQAEYAVCEIVNLSERDPTTTSVKENIKDMDKAMSAKFLDVVPVGSLTRKSKAHTEKSEAHTDQKFNFGLSVFPSLYADALYATTDELDIIFKVANALEGQPGQTKLTALPIGCSSIFGGYDVKVDINAFFGGHVAVLGNTGSGKSCTVSSVLQSLFSKPDDCRATGATFLVLDVNGEYQRALDPSDPHIEKPFELPEHISVKTLKLDGTANENSFTLPHWFLSQEEWELLLRASERAQRPALNRALDFAAMFARADNSEIKKLKNHILAKSITGVLSSDNSPPSKHDIISGLLQGFNTLDISLAVVVDAANQTTFKDCIKINYGQMPSQNDAYEFVEKFLLPDEPSIPKFTEVPFGFDLLLSALELAIFYEEANGNKRIRDYCSSMITRLNRLSTSSDFLFLRDTNPSTDQRYRFFQEVLGLNNELNKKVSQIIILDMNEVGDEVVELVTAVLSRMIFELLRKQNDRNKFPVHLVLEEAHRYVAQKPSQYAIDATQIFERIAKEGRKYGMFLVVASQRPSELSRTVLSQCANFIIHRIQNPDDLSHIRQMTPFISKNVLERLPSLPKQNALIFGNAVTLPTTFKVRDASPLPKSDDADISNVWFREAEKETNLDFTE